MKLHASALTGSTLRHVFTGYGEGYVMVNGVRHDTSLIVLPERMQPWEVAGFDALAETDFQVFLGMDLEILLLGTGVKQRFPHPRLTQALMRKRIGVDVMDLHAACRTYNILMSEERRVAAALLFS